MFYNGTFVCILDERESMRATSVANQKAVALGVVAGIVCPGEHLDKASVAVLAVPGRNSLADDAASGIFPDVYHLGAGVRLLEVVGNCHRVELRRGIVAFEDG